jgi:hypothetical protein
MGTGLFPFAAELVAWGFPLGVSRRKSENRLAGQNGAFVWVDRYFYHAQRDGGRHQQDAGLGGGILDYFGSFVDFCFMSHIHTLAKVMLFVKLMLKRVLYGYVDGLAGGGLMEGDALLA